LIVENGPVGIAPTGLFLRIGFMPAGAKTGNAGLTAHNQALAATPRAQRICVLCLTRPTIQSYTNKLGLKRYRKHCGACTTRLAKERLAKQGRRPLYGKHPGRIKKHYCEGCGIIPRYPNQLEVDHINGEHSDNSPENLWTLCVMCHREKTWLFDQNVAI
jgi:hypothetical protein